jgi:hypothetical protein
LANFKDGFAVLVLYEWHVVLNQERNLRFYFGGGGGIVGVARVIGLDYKFLRLPLNLSLAWQPSYQFGKVDEVKSYGGLALGFAFKMTDSSGWNQKRYFLFFHPGIF